MGMVERRTDLPRHGSSDDVARLTQIDKRDLEDARRVIARTKRRKTVAWDALKEETSG